ncbi:MAG: hypothetical protein COA44_00425 [Arcobacter sp.]|nr:MAG: hypothetical protein COA44_00425 [Arcobacter sp.]
MKNKNILIVIDSLGLGGAEHVVLTLATEFISIGHRVDIILIDDIVEQEIPKSIQLYKLGFEKSFLDYQRYSNKLHKKIDALEKEHKKTFDLILVNLQKSTRLMNQYKHKNIYHVIHNTLSQTSLKNRKGLRRYLKKRSLRKIYNNLNLITVSEGVAKDVKEVVGISPKSIQRIYNPINKQELQEKANEVSSLELDEYIIHVGRFDVQKNHLCLIKAFAQSDINIPLVLVGDGELKKEIQDKIDELELNERVIMIGQTKNPYPLIANAKALILSSDYEGLSMVIIEALALNIPVISTDCPFGPSEIMSGELSQYLVALNEENKLAEQIENVVANGYIIPENQIQKFESATIIKQYLSLIKE